jgi:hypothetical protein
LEPGAGSAAQMKVDRRGDGWGCARGQSRGRLQTMVAEVVCGRAAVERGSNLSLWRLLRAHTGGVPVNLQVGGRRAWVRRLGSTRWWASVAC